MCAFIPLRGFHGVSEGQSYSYSFHHSAFLLHLLPCRYIVLFFDTFCDAWRFPFLFVFVVLLRLFTDGPHPLSEARRICKKGLLTSSELFSFFFFSFAFTTDQYSCGFFCFHLFFFFSLASSSEFCASLSSTYSKRSAFVLSFFFLYMALLIVKTSVRNQVTTFSFLPLPLFFFYTPAKVTSLVYSLLHLSFSFLFSFGSIFLHT